MKKGILLDVGCGKSKHDTHWIGLDKIKLPGVDIVHDLEVFPYPLEDEMCITVVARHVLEHMKPWFIIDIMNELWRITQTGGQLIIGTPYGVSGRYIQDPSHATPFNETTFVYFDPFPTALQWKNGDPQGGGIKNNLYDIYRPKPWKIKILTWDISGDISCVLEKRPFDDYVKALYWDKDELCPS
jgi:hypothetical protein